MPGRRTRHRSRTTFAGQHSRPVHAPGSGAVRDRALTRQWGGRVGHLLTPRPAYLAKDDESAVFVDDAPAGSRIRIHDMYRVGPLNADIRALANPEAAPELWLIAPWYALTSP